MSWGINDIDLSIAILNGGIFCKNGDAAFFFKIVAVHNALSGAGGDHSGLLKQAINQGCFTMVNVGNYGDVAYVRIWHGTKVPLKIWAMQINSTAINHLPETTKVFG